MSRGTKNFIVQQNHMNQTLLINANLFEIIDCFLRFWISIDVN